MGAYTGVPLALILILWSISVDMGIVRLRFRVSIPISVACIPNIAVHYKAVKKDSYVGLQLVLGKVANKHKATRQVLQRLSTKRRLRPHTDWFRSLGFWGVGLGLGFRVKGLGL